MTIEDVLFFDTETTGIPPKGASWEKDFEQYPRIVEIAWLYKGKGETHIIRPEGWEIPEEAADVHGITTEYAREHGEAFVFVIDRFVAFCQKAGLLCGHNIHFDTGMIKANILRELGWEYYDANGVEDALFKGKRIDTMRASMKWVDARTASGRPKFPNLTELFCRCFPTETFEAHEALEDTKAVARCLPVLVDLGLVELKVKEYPDMLGATKMLHESTDKLAEGIKTVTEGLKTVADVLEKAQKGADSGIKEENDKSLIFSDKAPQNGNSAKISDIEAELLKESEF